MFDTKMINPIIRPVNLITMGYSFLLNYVTGNTTAYGMPVSVSIELTNHCNLRCPECLSGLGLMSRDKGFMEINLFEKIIGELSPYIYNLNLYFQGEPMLHPHFFSFLRASRNVKTTVATNGHFLSEENAQRLVISGLNTLIVSLDGMDRQTYSSYRVNGNFDQVMTGIRNVSEAKQKDASKMELIIQFLVNRDNENQIPEVRRFAKEIDARLKLKSMQILNDSSYERWLPEKKKFRRYESVGGSYVIKGNLPDRCPRLWFNPVITWDGKVVPCCFDKDANHIMGDLKEDTFREIWNGPRYRLFRKCIRSGRQLIDICRNCTSGLRGVVS